MSLRLILVFLSIIAVTGDVSGTVEDMTREIVDALAHAPFEEWSTVFMTTNDRIRGKVLRCTLFIPDSQLNSYRDEDRQKMTAYHIVPQRLEFEDLLSKTSQSRLPTLLTNNSILITNNSNSGFTLDGVLITEPDAFDDNDMTIHHIAFPLDFTTYGLRSESKHSSAYSTLRSEWPLFYFMLVTLVAAIISEIFFLSR